MLKKTIRKKNKEILQLTKRNERERNYYENEIDSLNRTIRNDRILFTEKREKEKDYSNFPKIASSTMNNFYRKIDPINTSYSNNTTIGKLIEELIFMEQKQLILIILL